LVEFGQRAVWCRSNVAQWSGGVGGPMDRLISGSVRTSAGEAPSSAHRLCRR